MVRVLDYGSNASSATVDISVFGITQVPTNTLLFEVETDVYQQAVAFYPSKEKALYLSNFTGNNGQGNLLWAGAGMEFVGGGQFGFWSRRPLRPLLAFDVADGLPFNAQIDDADLRLYSSSVLAGGIRKCLKTSPLTVYENGGEVHFKVVVDVDRVTLNQTASYAEFNETSAGGFLLTHDGRMSFDDLANAVGAAKYRDDPLDLVILSACETADGNARAALGLSGVAVKAGARSALGTLWSVSDEATSEFMAKFYSSLREPKTSRAQAVREAQVRLLKDPNYAHPYYWSPFLLINSWL